MVFVHSRKETVKSALALREAALAEGTLDDFSCQEHPMYGFFRRDIGMSRNKEMKQLFDNGFGIHHAGMLRSDRNMMERMFDARAIKVYLIVVLLRESATKVFYRSFVVPLHSPGVSTCQHTLVSPF